MKSHGCSPYARILLAGSVAFLCYFISSASAQRLPQIVRPEHYRLWLASDLRAATFSGVDTIDVNLAEPTNQITLNAAEIDFKNVYVRSEEHTSELQSR